MDWFNYYGLIFVAIILIPNVVYAIKHKDDPPGAYQNKAAVLFERIGRYGCMACMVFNIPYAYVGSL